MTDQMKPITRKKPLKRAARASAPYGELAWFGNIGMRVPKPIAQARSSTPNRIFVFGLVIAMKHGG